LKNCVIFNDKEWIDIEDKKTRPDVALFLEHGEPLVWGSPGHRKGIKMRNGIVSIVDLADDDDPLDKGIRVHDEKMPTPGYATILSSFTQPDYPIPVGVLRAVKSSVYEEDVIAQIDAAKEKRGEGTLEELLYSGDTWTVE
jgi:2-oxoglutarate ferredoxin oxidoreductase subunit beta